MLCLLDTNVLLRALDRTHPKCRLARRAIAELRRQEAQLFLAPQNLVEFWAVATRPASANGIGMTVSWAATQLTRMKRFFTVLTESPETLSEWERLVVQFEVSGKKAHDARLVAAMKVNSITHILTFNVEDFARFTDVQSIHPEQVLAQLR